MECTKHVVTDQRDITIRDLRDRVAALDPVLNAARAHMAHNRTCSDAIDHCGNEECTYCTLSIAVERSDHSDK